jgi:hypothetical protein
MKKLILFFLLFISTTIILPQNTDKETTALGMPISGDNALYQAFEKTLEVLRVKIVSGTIIATSDTVRLDNIITGIDSLIRLLQPNNKQWANNSLTVTTEIDSINAPTGTTMFWSVDIIGVEDTIEFCFDSKNFANPWRLFPNQSKYIERISVTAFPKIYIRRKGSVGTPIYDIDMIGY